MKQPDSRLPSLDALRGLIMILMALDHAVFFVAKRHPLEYWGNPLPQHQDAIWFLTRLLSHICAPGFFFLMGVSMALFAASRRKRGWSEGNITRHFVTRGLLLLLIQQFVVNPAWFLGTLGSTEILGSAGPPGGGGTVIFNLDVLYGLGACMILMSLFLRANALIVLLTSVFAIGVTQVLTPLPDQVNTLYSPLLRLLLIPGQTGMLLVSYPLIPWLGMTGFGLVFGRQLLHDRDRAFRSLWVVGAVSLVLFVVVRGMGGFGNLHPPSGADWVAFMNLTKYPPSPAFVLFFWGLVLLLLRLLSKLGSSLEQHHPFLIFGATALFFYTVHLYVYALSGLAFSSGAGLIATYLVWLMGLVLLYPLCTWYGSFKRGTAPDSIWRLF